MFWSSRASGLPRRLLIVAAAALIPVLAGCEAGSDAPTLHWHYPTIGAGTTTALGTDVSNVFVLGAPASPSLQPGQSAGLFFALVDNGSPDRLVSIQAPGTATSVTIPAGGIRLSSSQVVLLTGPEPRAVLNGLTRALPGGTAITLVLNFQNAGSVRLQVPVIPRSTAYATFSPPAPTPTPSVTPGKHHRATSPTPSVSGATTSPSAAASPSPSTTP